jgi:hypothetical protein
VLQVYENFAMKDLLFRVVLAVTSFRFRPEFSGNLSKHWIVRS